MPSEEFQRLISPEKSRRSTNAELIIARTMSAEEAATGHAAPACRISLINVGQQANLVRSRATRKLSV